MSATVASRLFVLDLLNRLTEGPAILHISF